MDAGCIRIHRAVETPDGNDACRGEPQGSSFGSLKRLTRQVDLQGGRAVQVRTQEGHPMKTRISHVHALAFATVAITSGGSALAQEKLVLKASDVHAAGYPTVVAVEDHRQEAREGHQRPHHRADVSVDAARRREGSRRAGAGRRHRLCARLGRRARPGGRRSQRLQPALRVPQHRAHAEGDRRRRSARSCSTR